MRRIRRAYQRNVRQEAKRRKKFRQRAIAAGTAAVITLGAGVSLNIALAHTPDIHELPVSQDADADLLANTEELAIGYRAFKPDQNRNEIPDGVELAKRCAAIIVQLPAYSPWTVPPDVNETYRICHEVDGLEQCDVCGQSIHMGGCCIINPRLNLRYPDPCDPLDPLFLPDLALHYMEHGSFDCLGSIHRGRVDLQRLTRVIELCFPYDPNEHQLPLNYVLESVGQLAPDANDLDGDLLADTEELTASYNLYDPDQDNDLSPDGIELAKQCAAGIDELPVHDPYSGYPAPTETYKIHHPCRGVESCDICGKVVNMCGIEIINPQLGTSIDVFYLSLHYMEHGSFSYAGSYNNGRADVPLLLKILEMPQRCGDLGTMYLPGDLNKDCRVDFADFAKFADKWLKCTDPSQDGCDGQ